MERTPPDLRIVGPATAYRPDLIDQLRPSTLQRIGDALGSPFGLGLYLGFYAGCLVTVVAAYLWGLYL